MINIFFIYSEHKDLFADLTGELPSDGEKPNFVWKRDGKPFDPEERFKVLLGKVYYTII